MNTSAARKTSSPRTCEGRSCDGVTFFESGERGRGWIKKSEYKNEENDPTSRSVCLRKSSLNNESSRPPSVSGGFFAFLPHVAHSARKNQSGKKNVLHPSLPRTHMHLLKMHNCVPRKHSLRFSSLAFLQKHTLSCTRRLPAAPRDTQTHVKEQTNGKKTASGGKNLSHVVQCYGAKRLGDVSAHFKVASAELRL